MSTKPFLAQVTRSIGNSQDGNTIGNDTYGAFLTELINQNTEDDKVDTEELASNLRYAIHEFAKALKEVEDFNV